MPSNPFVEQKNAFADMKKIVETHEKMSTPCNKKMLLIEVLSSYAVSRTAAQKYLAELEEVYEGVDFR
jgi:hypothetical protein